MAKNQKHYTPQFEQQIVDLYNAGETSYPQLEREHWTYVNTLEIGPRHMGSPQGEKRQRPGESHCGRTQAGFGGNGEFQGQPGGITADGVLQSDEAALHQADRGRKTMADPDCPKPELTKSYMPQRCKRK